MRSESWRKATESWRTRLA